MGRWHRAKLIAGLLLILGTGIFYYATWERFAVHLEIQQMVRAGRNEPAVSALRAANLSISNVISGKIAVDRAKGLFLVGIAGGALLVVPGILRSRNQGAG